MTTCYACGQEFVDARALQAHDCPEDMTDSGPSDDKTIPGAKGNRVHKECRNDSPDSEHYGPRTPCSQCGEALSESAPEWAEYCHLHRDKQEGPNAVPIEELEPLVQEWRERNEGYLSEGQNLYATAADELQEVIDRYE